MIKQLLHKILFCLSSRASVGRVLLTFFAIVLIPEYVGATNWEGVDPFNYYYLKNVGAKTYLYSRSSKKDNQWFSLKHDSLLATRFTYYKYYDPSEKKEENRWKARFAFFENSQVYWLAKDGSSGTKKHTDIYDWIVVDGVQGFQIRDGGKRINSWPDTIITLVDENDNNHTWVYWDTIRCEESFKPTQYYLYNVGTRQFLFFNDEGNGYVRTYLTRTPAFASLVAIDKNTMNENATSCIKTTLNGRNYYLYHEKGTNKQGLNDSIRFTILPKTIDGVNGFILQSKNKDNYDRLAYASGDCPYVQFYQKSNVQSNDKNSLWLFIPISEYEAKVGNPIQALPHVTFQYDKDKCIDGKITTHMVQGYCDDSGEVFLTAYNDTFDIHFDGIPDKLLFQYRPEDSKGWLTGNDDRIFSVYESADGKNWRQIFQETNNSDDYVYVSKQLTSNSRYVRFCFNGDNDGGRFKEISITELFIFEAEENNVIDFGPVNVQEVEYPSKIIHFLHANASAADGVNPVTISSTSGVFEPTHSTLHNTGEDKMGVENCEILFRPDKALELNLPLNEQFTGYVEFQDIIKDTTYRVKVTVTPTMWNVPKFTWNALDLPYYCASSEEGAPPYSIPHVWSSTNNLSNTTFSIIEPNPDDGKVYVDLSDTTLYINIKDNEPRHSVTIRVSQSRIEGLWYEKAEDYTFTPHKKIDLMVPFKVTEDIFENAYEIKTKPVYRWVWPDGSWIPQKVMDVGYKWDEKDGAKLGGDDANAWPDYDFPSTVYETKYVIYQFEGTPDSLFFKYRTNNKAASEGGWIGTPPHWYVFESSDGEFPESTTSAIWHDQRSASTFKDTAIALSHDTRYVKLAYQGNFAAYFNDVSVSAFDGFYYVKMQDEEKYLSRGGCERNKAVVDDYGITMRKTRSKDDVEFTHFQYVDNNKFLSEDADGHLITNVTSRRFFSETNFEETSGVDFILSTANNIEDPTTHYLKVDLEKDTIVLVDDDAQATHWKLEKPIDHEIAMSIRRDNQVKAATSTGEFILEPVNTLAGLRARLQQNDYDRDTVFNPIILSAIQQFEDNPNNQSEVYSCCVDNLTPGLYCLNVKALYRVGPNVSAYKNYLSGYDSPVAYVSLLDLSTDGKTASTRICSVYSSRELGEGEECDYRIVREEEGGSKTYHYPGGTTSANSMLNKINTYDNDVYLYVQSNDGEKGAVRLSIQAPSNSNDSNWLCYKNITLTRLYRKEFTFSKAGDWNYAGNWSGGVVPEPIHKVIIGAAATISSANVGAYSVKLSGTGSITINSDASLSIREGGIEGATTANLTLEADKEHGTGALRLYPGTEAPAAKVQMYSVVDNAPNDPKWEWQYIGSPITQETTCNNEAIFYNCWLYQHDTKTDTWSSAGNWSKMEPFRGYAFTRNNGNSGNDGSRPSTGPLFEYNGTLNAAPKEPKVLLLDYGTEEKYRENFIANSWAAPIQIKNFSTDDFINVGKTIYLYPAKDKGEVTSIAPFTAEYTGNDTIPAMQGFSVKTTGANPKLILDYERLVWKSEIKTNGPLKAPARAGKRAANTDLQSRICVNLMAADSIPDRIYLLEKEGEGFSRAYTEGYDAPKYIVEGLPCIYTYEMNGKHLAVSATDSILGTYLAINTDSSHVYTVTFSMVVGEGLGLRDLVTDMVVPIIEGGQYTFTATPNMTNQLRFVVEEYITPEDGGNGGTETTSLGEDNLHIWQNGDLLSVTNAGSHSMLVLYDAAGKQVLQWTFNDATVVNLSSLPSGVYMAAVNNKTIKVLR